MNEQECWKKLYGHHGYDVNWIYFDEAQLPRFGIQ